MRSNQRRKGVSRKRIKVSIVIAAYNEEKEIWKVLDSLKGQDCEIIVVDDKSEDRTVEIAKKYGCKIFTSGKHSLAYSRNFGIDKAKGNVVAVLDASEFTVAPNFVKEVKKTFEKDRNIEGLYVREKYKKRTLVNRLGWYRTFYKPYVVVRVFRKIKRKDGKSKIRYDESVPFWNVDTAINDQLGVIDIFFFPIKQKWGKVKYCGSTYIMFDMFPTWTSLFDSWRGYGEVKLMSFSLSSALEPLLFAVTSPIVALHRLIKFRKLECLLIPVFDTVRTVGFIYGVLRGVLGSHKY
jgi:glycosyltransferase involved in cell wall biosynthesis